GSVLGVSSISLADSGTPGTLQNTVLVNVDLDDNYVMPPANTDITIYIDGSADLINYTVSGVYNTTVSNTVSSNESNIPYTGSGNNNQQVTLFTKTFTASQGYAFLTAPFYALNVNSASKYAITYVDTLDSEDRITARNFTVKYTFSDESDSGDVINFTANAAEIFEPATEITAYNIITTNIDPSGATRSMSIYGSEGAEFSLSVLNEDTTSIASKTDVAIPASGVYTFDIVFPSVTDSDQYDFVLTGDLSGDFDTTSGQDSLFSISQALNINISIGLTHPESAVSISPYISKTVLPASQLDEFTATFNNDFTISVTSPSSLTIDDGSVDLSEFTNTNSSTNGGTVIDIESLSFTTVSSTEITASLQAQVFVSGITDLTSVLDLDSYIGYAGSVGIDFITALEVDDCNDASGIAEPIVEINSSQVVVDNQISSEAGGSISPLAAGNYRLTALELGEGDPYNIGSVTATSYMITIGAGGLITNINPCI
ncbi:MAG: hypothetical protein P8I94_06970, partial [Emcibacteraceae bacterium]|nr:hypothetical protein [Emcibacteraceae bacterium]